MKKKKTSENKTVVYCGPTISGVVRRGNGFKDGVLPAELQEHMEKCPALKELVVPVNRFAETNRQLRDPHSPKSICFEKAATYIKNGGEQ